MTIGKEWKKSLKDKTAQGIRTEADKVHEEVLAIIAAIPERVSAAIASSADSIDLGLGFLGPNDVRGGDVDQCFDTVRDRGHGVLQVVDLAGRARTVFVWCAENGLACYLEPHKVQDSPFLDFNYSLCARPS